ncbi:hypothetical protein CYMTET_30198 [Cymbomonas tetramitiformis]|uniref:Uncharacterized protein n=1 Tax=Cymbomonas tetramitiformis TaxID=36881 RepID=A0AAE0KU60_9CHLO|nr:hypothetical protein CYMTET_30198 [Cymbomonas tetramitiformis]
MPWYSRVSRLFKSDKSPGKAEELYTAVEKGDLKLVKKLLKYSKYFEANNTKKGCWSLVHTAAFAGHKDVLEVLVSKYGEVTMRAEDDLTPLHLAANKGNLAAVKFLLEKGAALDAVTKEHNWTPLHSAILLGHSSVVGELLLKKASPDAQDKVNFSQPPSLPTVAPAYAPLFR